MLRKRRLFIGSMVIAFAAFAATEGAIFSMIASGFGRITSPAAQALSDGDRVHDLPNRSQFSLLAAGDIAACGVDGGIDRANRNLRYALGIERPKPKPNKGMVATSRLLEQNAGIEVLALGDLAYKRGEPVSFQDCYDPYWGKAKARTWPAPGNHEYQSLGAYGYFDYWGNRAGPDRNGYYALRTRSWILLSLNSEIDAAEGSVQADWINSVLAANKGRCVGAFYHKPAFSAVERRRSENAKLLFARLADAGAVFVLNGHNHFFERTVPLDAEGRPTINGTTILVAGAGGKVTTGNVPANERTAELVTEIPGVLKLDFMARSVSWAYLSGLDTETIAAGTLPCS